MNYLEFAISAARIARNRAIESAIFQPQDRRKISKWILAGNQAISAARIALLAAIQNGDSVEFLNREISRISADLSRIEVIIIR